MDTKLYLSRYICGCELDSIVLKLLSVAKVSPYKSRQDALFNRLRYLLERCIIQVYPEHTVSVHHLVESYVS